jgi:3-oxoacyl-[acyl-carrier-protein] synthase-3
VSNELFKTVLFLPSQAAAETEATITKWFVTEGNSFGKGQALAEVESAKSTFEFEAPCEGTVIKLLVKDGASTSFESPVIEIETSDQSIKAIPSFGAKPAEALKIDMIVPEKTVTKFFEKTVSLLGIGAYLPKRIVYNSDLLKEHSDITDDYIFGVTGIKERRWTSQDEKPSDMAYGASKIAIEKSGLTPQDIGAIIISTSTPDMVYPSTACILQEKLGIRGVPAFDMTAACSGWLYGITVAKSMIIAGVADNILVTSVELQSRTLDKKDRNTYFLFGDGSGATVVSGSKPGHKILNEIVLADSAGLHMARREMPGYEVPENLSALDPWIRLDGKSLFRFATESFSRMVKELAVKSGWQTDDVRWVVPHQANSRIIKAAAQKSGVPFEKFYLNIDKVGNTGSASIPIALSEVERGLQKNDKVIFCTVGAGITAAGMSIEW